MHIQNHIQVRQFGSVSAAAPVASAAIAAISRDKQLLAVSCGAMSASAAETAALPKVDGGMGWTGESGTAGVRVPAVSAGVQHACGSFAFRERVCARPPRRAVLLLRGLPPALGGLALGLCGLGGLLLELQRATEVPVRMVAIMQAAIWVTTVAALVLVLLACARAVLCAEEVRKELREPALVTGHIACVYALMLLCSRNSGVLGSRTARALLTAACVPLVALIIRFIERCWRTATYPEPFYNPPTNPAVVVLAGIGVAVTPWLLMPCFVIGLLGAVSLVPAQVWRTLRSPEDVGKDSPCLCL